MFQAVIFDWDGTLADTRSLIVNSFQKALTEVNCKVSDDYIERRIGIGAAETFREILRAAKSRFDEKLVESLVEKKSNYEIELSRQVKLFVKLFPGAKELLQALNGQIRMGLASMNNRSVISHMVEENELEKCFEVILTAESISKSKPNPEIFLKAASELKVDPQKCVVIEDSVFGVKAAKSAGMGCIAVTTGVYSRRELEMERPDLIVESLNDKRILLFILS